MNTSIIKPSAIVPFFLILAILNGFIATLGLFLSIYTLCKFRSDEYSPYQYFLATTSLILTIMPFVLIELTKTDGKDYSAQIDLAVFNSSSPETCPTINEHFRDRYDTVIKRIPSACGTERIKDVEYLSKGLYITFYSAIFSPVSVAAYFLPQPEVVNTCQKYVKEYAEICSPIKGSELDQTINKILELKFRNVKTATAE